MRTHERDIAAVAAAALAWNRARLVRIATAKRADMPHPLGRLEQARKAESKAKAALRKACAKADPAPLTIDAEPLPAKAGALVLDVKAKEVSAC